MAASTAAGSRDDRAAVDKAMALLAAFGNDAFTGVGVSELARRADMSKSTAFRVLGMLQRSGAVDRAGNAYRLGKLIHNLGAGQETAANGRIRDALTPHLADLYVLSRQTVHLAVLDGGDVVYLNKLYGHLQVRSPSRIGGRAPAYCTGVGKVLLAYDDRAAELVLKSELAAWTPKTITDPAKLRAELEQVRATNVGFDREEILLGLNCIAAPVMGPDGKAVAALSVSGPAGQFVPESQANALRKVCFEASRTIAAVAAQRENQLRLIRGA
ncbi:IclR family transcriptional regulator [Pseudarthrobacter sp. J75]|uniref:IclR family transcriptional regulator n=1 Tax=unclassified Pseudarthrobacter TaxID=2647000 RepID=UPI002E809256|nr:MULTISPECIES: IclR family transcriptional regulator [unclassified Pseudarthrobacter]MEE2523646.1 IclR family transcriptional regulator [Pseudarthrobacter sp. J47]MEE2530036.1 IclR family transcriptional regulator [Pseudarthrobacter sp. J75]MEE2570554.1 IclR family transcriptional regulator [Pseudarthrobacter sp. J64]